jgi:hypothetical protein
MWTKEWSRLQVLILFFVLLAVHLLLQTPKFLYYLRLFALDPRFMEPQDFWPASGAAAL